VEYNIGTWKRVRVLYCNFLLRSRAPQKVPWVEIPPFPPFIMTNKKQALLFLDMEFTGFENHPNQAWEIGWILDVDGQIVSQQSYYLYHTTEASDWVRKNTLYNKIFDKSIKAKMYQEINNCIPVSMKTALSELLLDLSTHKMQYDVYVIGAAIEGDHRYLLNAAKEHGFDLGLHWRAIDLSNVFLGYMWAQGKPLAAPLAVVKMMRELGLESIGKRHTVDVDNEDLRRVYYAMQPKKEDVNG